MNAKQAPWSSTPKSVPRRHPEALVQHFEAESLLMEPASAYTCALNPTGAVVWELIDGKRSVAEIAALIARNTGAAPAQVEPDVRHFLDEMCRAGFVYLHDADDQEAAAAGPSFAATLKRLTDAVDDEANRYEQDVAESERSRLFIPSEPARLFGALQAARRHTSRFVELGSGLGGITLLAALLGFEPATGIEHDAELTRRAERLATDLGLEGRATFHTGNFFPADYAPPAGASADYYRFDGESRFADLDVPSHDCWLATPFPQTQQLVEQLFATHARPGSLLLIYQGIGPVEIRTAAGASLTYHGPESDTELTRLLREEDATE